jgi:hypothetical protein
VVALLLDAAAGPFLTGGSLRAEARRGEATSRSEQPASRVLILAGTRHSPRGGTSRRRALALSVIRFCAGPAMAFGGVVIGDVKSGTTAVDLLADRIDLIEAVTDIALA